MSLGDKDGKQEWPVAMSRDWAEAIRVTRSVNPNNNEAHMGRR
jgi:hypothetical protein